MNTLKILDPIAWNSSNSPHSPDSHFGFCAGEPYCGEWWFSCMVEASFDGNDADLWQHKFTADIYMQGYGNYVAAGPKVWAKSAVAHITGEDKALDFHTALRPFLSDCVFDALLAGYHIVGTYRHDGREWNLNLLDPPDVLDLPDLPDLTP